MQKTRKEKTNFRRIDQNMYGYRLAAGIHLFCYSILLTPRPCRVCMQLKIVRVFQQVVCRELLYLGSDCILIAFPIRMKVSCQLEDMK